MSSRYDPDSSVKDNLISLSDGNPGALNVLTQVADHKSGQELESFFKTLDEMNMYGPRIWLGFKDHCGEDIGLFMDCVESQDEDMVETINDMKRGGEDVRTI